MRILMVCLGNICRSPLAHGVMQHLIEERQLNWTVDSAGTGDWHIGQQPDRRSIRVAKGHGVDIAQQAAQWFQPALFHQFDKILVMDRQNHRDVIRQAPTVLDKAKVMLFLDDAEVPDPYYDDALFEPVFQMIEKRSKILLEQWINE